MRQVIPAPAGLLRRKRELMQIPGFRPEPEREGSGLRQRPSNTRAPARPDRFDRSPSCPDYGRGTGSAAPMPPPPAKTARIAQIGRAIAAALCLALIAAGLFGLHTGLHAGRHTARAQSGSPVILTAQIEDTITPVKARYIARAVERAGDRRAELLLITLNTPGGLYDSTRQIVGSLLESPTPVVVFVAPRGAQAGSAGTFITAAAHIAAMAPGSNIGAATPVSASGEDIGETLASKATNDAAALIRAIADARGRNADALEQTVRTAASYTANEALDANIIDLTADTLPDLLAAIDGRVVTTAAGPRTLRTADADLRPLNMQWRERLVDFIANPNIAFLLLTIGSLGLVFEMMTPGMIGPGVAGVICLGLGFLALGNLPFNWAGVAFILLAIILAALEIFVSGFGALGIGAVVSLIIGGVLLFGSFGGGIPAGFPDISVSVWLLAAVGGILALAAAYLAYEAVMSRAGSRRAAATAVGAAIPDSDGRSSASHLIGQTGIVTAPLRPRGIVALHNETWSAISLDGTEIAAGQPVQVAGAEGLVLTVRPVGTPQSAPEAPPPASGDPE